MKKMIFALTLAAFSSIAFADKHCETQIPIVTSVNLSAVGEVDVTPDVAILSGALVQHVGSSADSVEPEPGQSARALERLEQQLKSILKVAQENGVPEKNITAADFSVSPRQKYNTTTRRNEQDGFTFSRSVQIRLEETGKIAPIMRTMVTAGLTNVQPTHLLLSNALEISARKEATNKAMDLLNEQIGALGELVIIGKLDVGGGRAPVRPQGRNYTAYADAEVMSSVQMPTVSVGQNRVAVQVSAEALIRLREGPSSKP